MKRRTLDILFSLGGVGLAGLLLVLGLVMANRGNFATDYVRDQLTPQDIEFKKLNELAPQERRFSEARSAVSSGTRARP